MMDLLHTNAVTGISGTKDDLQSRDDCFGNN